MFVLLTVCVATGSATVAQESTTLVGTVTVVGPIPAPQQVIVKRDADFCGNQVAVQPVTVSKASRGLLHAVVSVEGLKVQSSAPQRTPTVIKNRKCAFMPRISTMQVETLLEVGNDDPVLHNTHIRNQNRTILNVAMVPFGRTIQKTVKEPGLLKLQCDAHRFMEGYTVVFEHPYFAITDETGRFRIPGLPPGIRRITIWHETLGVLEQEVNIPAQGEFSVHFNYSSPSGP